MNWPPLIYLGSFLAMACSWFTFVLMPHLQFGRLEQTDTKAPTPLYPGMTPGEAHQGANVYRANGCVYCHSQQIGQTDVGLEVTVGSVGTNQTDVTELRMALRRAYDFVAAQQGGEAKPDTEVTLEVEALQAGKLSRIEVASGLDKRDADAAVKIVGEAGDDVKVAMTVVPKGADLERWGASRRSVALDYLYDYPVQLGSKRLGPDLANIGSRMPDVQHHLLHLYHPQSVTPNSVMPAYKYLFEEVPSASPRATQALELPEGIPADYRPSPGYVVVPRPEALQLVAYLKNLQGGPRVFQAPMPPDAAPVAPKADAAAKSN